jgi:hypothetical protein
MKYRMNQVHELLGQKYLVSGIAFPCSLRFNQKILCPSQQCRLYCDCVQAIFFSITNLISFASSLGNGSLPTCCLRA